MMANNLALALAEATQAESGAPTHEVQRILVADALLDLASALDGDPPMAASAGDTLDGTGIEEATTVARLEITGSLAELDRALNLAEAHPDVMDVPLLTDDPALAERVHQGLASAIAARERIYRMARVAAWLGVPTETGVEAYDVRLRSILRHAWLVEPLRAQMLEGVAVESRDAHWWLSQRADPPGVSGADDPDVLDDAFDLIGAWATERMAPTTDGRLALRLDRVEARALLATPAGRAFANAMGDTLDLDAGEVTDDELRLVDSPVVAVATPATRPAVRATLVHAVVRAAASTDRPSLIATGTVAASSFGCTYAALVPGCGVVAYGEAFERPPARDAARAREAWLVVFDTAVAEGCLSDGYRFMRLEVGGAVLVEPGEGSSLRLEVTAAGEASWSVTLYPLLASATVPRDAGTVMVDAAGERLAALLAAIGDDDLADAREIRQELDELIDADDLATLSGLDTLLEALQAEKKRAE